MAVYSNVQIRQAIEQGHIQCHPYNPAHVSHASLDVTLGHHFYRIEQANERVIYNPFDREDVERYFDGPYAAMAHGDWCRLTGVKPVSNIPLDHPVIAIKPRERILAHTHEFIGILPPGACEIRARSSWSRNGLAVGTDAGWVAPGFINRLALEIYNLNERKTILLPVGERFAQVVFHKTGEVEGSYGSSEGKYQQGTDLDTVIKIWSPDMMLPKAYLDKRSIPPKIDGATYA